MQKRALAREVNELVGEKVMMAGWVQTMRQHAKVAFIDLRDRTGLTQLVFTGDALAMLDGLTVESVITVTGEVTSRPQSLVNPNIVSGQVELQVQKITVESIASPLPLPLNDPEVSEDVRLTHRYLDLRSKRLSQNLRQRSEVIHYIRNEFAKREFVEVETPYLSKSTPEGARDYLVPARIEPGNFYALPQSPQQYKQLLMVAGLEKYFQIVRCFRDEDSRKDRQPEFTQLDVELSFTSQEEVLQLIEEVYLGLITKLFPEKVLTHGLSIPRFTYKEVMEKYGDDHIDLRQDKNNPDELSLAFVVDFPLFEYKEGDKRWGAVHHPFTAPAPEWQDKFESDPKNAIAQQYDLILNGSEIAGGSIRIHQPEVLERVFAFLGHSKEEIQAKFGHLLSAFTYGAPPHGGFASGLDRLLAVLLKEPNIREVIAFPKTGDGHDLMMHSPSSVDAAQLKELGIKTLL